MSLYASGKAEFEKLFKDSFEEYFDGLYFYAHTYLRDEAKAKDVVQGVFLKWWESQKVPGNLDACKAYLYVAVYRRSLNAIRDEKIMRAHSDQYMSDLSSTNYSWGDADFTEEIYNRIERAIESLPTQGRIIFKKSRYEEKTYQQIATEMNLSVKTVEVHISRALKNLRQRLNDYLH